MPKQNLQYYHDEQEEPDVEEYVLCCINGCFAKPASAIRESPVLLIPIIEGIQQFCEDEVGDISVSLGIIYRLLRVAAPIHREDI